jgi:hypothetical protein
MTRPRPPISDIADPFADRAASIDRPRSLVFTNAHLRELRQGREKFGRGVQVIAGKIAEKALAHPESIFLEDPDLDR